MSCFFVFNVRCLVLGLPVKWMGVLWNVFQCWKQTHDIPDCVSVLFTDLIALKKKSSVFVENKNNNSVSRNASGYMSVLYHNKGIDMVNLPRILNNKYVRDAVPSVVQNMTPPIVSFKYTKTIGGKIFNQKKVVKDLNVDIGTSNMYCECNASEYCYGPVGHVVTGDLSIIRDAKLRSLIEKGPSYREQNQVNWSITERLCKEAVAKYKRKWARKEKVDIRVLNEWECKVNECVQNRIALLKRKHINRRKSHILRNRRHSRSLEELHSKYVLVPADKAAQNPKALLIDILGFLETTVLGYHRSVNVCLHFIGFQSFTNSLMELDS